jgi:hypothetical protein
MLTPAGAAVAAFTPQTLLPAFPWHRHELPTITGTIARIVAAVDK